MMGKAIETGHESPYTVWLRSDNPNTLVGIDYRQLNWYIQQYNHKLWKYVDFWEWLSYELFEDEYHLTGISALWSNYNRMEVLSIK